MARVTLKRLADSSGVSVATLNRIMRGADNVRQSTVAHVLSVAEQIGFYGVETIRRSVAPNDMGYRFGFVLQQSTRPFYQSVAKSIQAAVARRSESRIDVVIDFADDLSPQNIAAKVMHLGEDCRAVGVVAAAHPHVVQAVASLIDRGIPVFSLISPLTLGGSENYIGLDHWKVGRTAAWAVHRLCREPGKIGVMVGSHRHRNQEINESAFRAYFREHAPQFVLLEAQATFETTAVAHELTERLLKHHPDLAGVYLAGGGVSGVVAALRESGRSEPMVNVVYELTDMTRAALIDGVVDFVIAHPLDQLGDAVVERMLMSVERPSSGNHTFIPEFLVYTRENV